MAPRWLRLAAYALVGLALALVFAAYLSPHLVMDLATRVWACF
jgi:predicted exporter